MKGLYKLRSRGMGFNEETWKKIGLYVYSRKGNTQLLKDIPEAKPILMQI
jgi:hypothetical protein